MPFSLDQFILCGRRPLMVCLAGNGCGDGTLGGHGRKLAVRFDFVQIISQLAGGVCDVCLKAQRVGCKLCDDVAKGTVVKVMLLLNRLAEFSQCLAA